MPVPALFFASDDDVLKDVSIKEALQSLNIPPDLKEKLLVMRQAGHLISFAIEKTAVNLGMNEDVVEVTYKNNHLIFCCLFQFFCFFFFFVGFVCRTSTFGAAAVFVRQPLLKTLYTDVWIVMWGLKSICVNNVTAREMKQNTLIMSSMR